MLGQGSTDRFANTDELIDALRGCVGDRAFLRDAERLPGIRESGFDLSRSISAAGRSPSPQPVRVDDGPADMSEPATDDELAHIDSLGTNRFARTMRIPSLRAQGKSQLYVAVAIVLLTGVSFALWYLRAGHAPEGTQAAPVRDSKSRGGSAVPPPPTATPPLAVEASAPLPVPSAKSRRIRHHQAQAGCQAGLTARSRRDPVARPLRFHCPSPSPKPLLQPSRRRLS